MRSSVSVQVSTKIFGIINKWGGLGGVHYKHWGLKKKLTSRWGVYFVLKSNRGRTFILRYNMLEYSFSFKGNLMGEK